MSTILFSPDLSDGIARRVADFLDFRARISPYEWTRYEEIAQVVLRLGHPIGAGSPFAESLREFVYRSRSILIGECGRALLTNGNGARATVDGGDVFRHRMERDVYRFGRSFARIYETRLLVAYAGLDEDAEPATADYLRLLDRKIPEMIPDVTTVCRALPKPGQGPAHAGRQLGG